MKKRRLSACASQVVKEPESKDSEKIKRPFQRTKIVVDPVCSDKYSSFESHRFTTDEEGNKEELKDQIFEMPQYNFKNPV